MAQWIRTDFVCNQKHVVALGELVRGVKNLFCLLLMPAGLVLAPWESMLVFTNSSLPHVAARTCASQVCGKHS